MWVKQCLLLLVPRKHYSLNILIPQKLSRNSFFFYYKPVCKDSINSRKNVFEIKFRVNLVVKFAQDINMKLDMFVDFRHILNKLKCQISWFKKMIFLSLKLYILKPTKTERRPLLTFLLTFTDFKYAVQKSSSEKKIINWISFIFVDNQKKWTFYLTNIEDVRSFRFPITKLYQE